MLLRSIAKGLTEWSEEVARFITRRPKKCGISASRSNGFDDQKQTYYGLDHLKEISEDAAHALARVDATLALNGLTHLSCAVALALSKHAADLHLDGLTDLSDSADRRVSHFARS